MSKQKIDAMDSDTALVFTDGSAYPNPKGRGGWAFYASRKGVHTFRYGFSKKATNNSMELTAIIRALEYVPAGERSTCPFVIYTDSNYCLKALTVWSKDWIQSGWRTSTGKKVKNKELIERAVALIARHETCRPFEIRWVRGHSGIPENEMVDLKANEARRGQITNWKEKDIRNR